MNDSIVQSDVKISLSRTIVQITVKASRSISCCLPSCESDDKSWQMNSRSHNKPAKHYPEEKVIECRTVNPQFRAFPVLRRADIGRCGAFFGSHVIQIWMIYCRSPQHNALISSSPSLSDSGHICHVVELHRRSIIIWIFSRKSPIEQID